MCHAESKDLNVLLFVVVQNDNVEAFRMTEYRKAKDNIEQFVNNQI